jgi:hypothetical protein
VLDQARNRLAQVVAQQGYREHPGDCAHGTPDHEATTVHLGDAGDHGDVGPDHGDEPSDHQGGIAALLEELVGLLKVAPLQDPAVPLHLVADHVPGERGDREDHHDQYHVLVQLACGDEQSRRDQQRVTGEEREEQAALDEQQHSSQPDEFGVVVQEEPIRVHPVHAQQHRGYQRSHPLSVTAST